MSPNILSPASSGKQPQSKRSIFNSCINHLNDLTNINHLRQIQATYDPRQAPETLKLQLLIKAQKSLILDAETSGRDSHAVSKQLYLWSYEQSDRAIQDVGDRLAYMTYQFGDLQSQFSQSLEKSRADLKQIRNLENELIRLRDREKALQAQISKSQQDDRSKKAETMERMNVMMKEHESIEERMRDITNQLPGEKRKLMKSSYQTQFQAYQELADKLSIISHFGQLLLHELDDDPSIEYTGKDRTANIKGQASHSLAHYRGPSKPNEINKFEPQTGASELHRADTRMFGETHPHILNSTDGVNTVDQETSHPPTSSNANERMEPIIRLNDGRSEDQSGSGGLTSQASGSSHPPKLPERPKVKTPEFPPDLKVHPDDEKKASNESAPNDANSQPLPQPVIHDEPLTTSNLDLPPAYSPTQSKNP